MKINISYEKYFHNELTFRGKIEVSFWLMKEITIKD
jgi:hypothetical protein